MITVGWLLAVKSGGKAGNPITNNNKSTGYDYPPSLIKNGGRTEITF